MSASDVIKQAFSAYRAWGPYLVGLTGAFFLAVGAVCAVLGLLLGEAGYLPANVMAFAGSAWALAMIVDAIAALEEPTADRSLAGRVRAVLPYAGTLFLVWILYTAGLTVGFLLFIVPGVVFSVWWALVVPIVVLERKGVHASFGRSRQLVTGRGRTVFGTLFISGVLALVPGLAIYVAVRTLPVSAGAADLITQFAASSVCLPFFAICQTVLYADLRSRFAAPSSQAWA
ncbi:MAG: hypothetical protein ACRDNG_10780 [Gaiellaceae bacterium]